MRNNRVCSEGHTSHDDSSFKSIPIALNARDEQYRVVRENSLTFCIHGYLWKPVYTTEKKITKKDHFRVLLAILSYKVQYKEEKKRLFYFYTFSQLCVIKSEMTNINFQVDLHEQKVASFIFYVVVETCFNDDV